MATDNFGNTYIITKIMPPGSYFFTPGFEITYSSPFCSLVKIREDGSRAYSKLLYFNNATLDLQHNDPVIVVQPQTGLVCFIFNFSGIVYVMVSVPSSITIDGFTYQHDTNAILGWAFLPDSSTYFMEFFPTTDGRAKVLEFSGEMIMIGGTCFLLFLTFQLKLQILHSEEKLLKDRAL